MPARPHLAVKLARKATPDDLLSRLSDSYGTPSSRSKRVELVLKEGTPASLAVYTTKTLSPADRIWIWDLFERNMRLLYESSTDGYDSVEKKKELFHSESRFLVLYPASSSPPPAKPTTAPSPPPLGYCMFRWDTEDTASQVGDGLCDVAYCYELQVSADAQRLGVGKRLMEALEWLGKAYKMDKVMLTVFKANEGAEEFYRRIGFSVDEIDPGEEEEEEEEEEEDYRILSKEL